MTQADLSALGARTITAFTALPGDGAPANDGTSIGVQSLPTVTAFPYLEDFDPSGLSDWISGGNNDTWVLGAPAKASLNGAASGVNCWVNGGLSGQYLDNEQSFVVGPIFDFSALTNPQISLSVWWECEWSWDGAVLQSSIDGGASWQNVGALNDPNNWYNDSTILGLAWSGGQVGWSGSAATINGSGGWVTATHPMFDLGGQPNVLIRVAFGSDASTVDEGFAFDDVLVFDNPPAYPGTATDAILLGTGVTDRRPRSPATART